MLLLFSINFNDFLWKADESNGVGFGVGGLRCETARQTGHLYTLFTLFPALLRRYQSPVFYLGNKITLPLGIYDA